VLDPFFVELPVALPDAVPPLALDPEPESEVELDPDADAARAPAEAEFLQ
jgi:hypothetical protein